MTANCNNFLSARLFVCRKDVKHQFFLYPTRFKIIDYGAKVHSKLMFSIYLYHLMNYNG